MPKITDLELKKINDKRRRRNLPRLTSEQAQRIVDAQVTITPGFDVTSFLIGFATGHSNFTPEGMLGAALHQDVPVGQVATIVTEPSVGPNTQTVSTEPAPSSPDPTPSALDPAPTYDSSSSAASFTSDNGGNI